MRWYLELFILGVLTTAIALWLTLPVAPQRIEGTWYLAPDTSQPLPNVLDHVLIFRRDHLTTYDALDALISSWGGGLYTVPDAGHVVIQTPSQSVPFAVQVNDQHLLLNDNRGTYHYTRVTVRPCPELCITSDGTTYGSYPDPLAQPYHERQTAYYQQLVLRTGLVSAAIWLPLGVCVYWRRYYAWW